MRYIDDQLIRFKRDIENAIVKGGVRGKESMIRSSTLINYIHDAVKYEFMNLGVNPERIYPQLNATKPEIKLAGYLKQKNQDVCIIPKNIKPIPQIIDWGPMAFKKSIDSYGYEFSLNTLVINIRSQMSSIGKNSDTLFERTFAEALNLHNRYNNITLGEVYLIPTHEYDDIAIQDNVVAYSNRKVDIEKYICFFDDLNNRKTGEDTYKYERCALLIVDFRRDIPRLYRTTQELIDDGLINKDFAIDYSTLNFDSFASDLLDIYSTRFNINNLL